MESVLLRLSQAGLHHWRRILWWLCLILDFQLHQFQIVSNCEVIKVTWDAFASQVSWPKRDEFCASKPCDPLKLSDWSSQPSSGSSRRILRCPTKHTHTHPHTTHTVLSEALPRLMKSLLRGQSCDSRPCPQLSWAWDITSASSETLSIGFPLQKADQNSIESMCILVKKV